MQLHQKLTENGVHGTQWVAAQWPVGEVLENISDSATDHHLSMEEFIALVLESSLSPVGKYLAQVGAQCICSVAYQFVVQNC